MHQSYFVTKFQSERENEYFKNYKPEIVKPPKELKYDLNKYLSVFKYNTPSFERNFRDIPYILNETYDNIEEKEKKLKVFIAIKYYLNTTNNTIKSLIRNQRIENVILNEIIDPAITQSSSSSPSKIQINPDKILYRINVTLKERPKSNFLINTTFKKIECFKLMYEGIKIIYEDFPVSDETQVYDNPAINGTEITAFYDGKDGTIKVSFFKPRNLQKVNFPKIDEDIEELSKLIMSSSPFSEIKYKDIPESSVIITDKYIGYIQKKTLNK